MTRQHTIRVTDMLHALDVELAEFVADIEVNIIPESGDGWNEPREPGYFEMNGVTQVSGPYIKPASLADWACRWVDAHQDAIACDIERKRPEVEF